MQCSEAAITIVVALIGSGIWNFILQIVGYHHTKQNSSQKMLLGLAHDRLYKLLDDYLIRGYITPDELENLEYLYKPYRALGGNGTCERMYEQVNLLPHKKEEDNGNE